MTVTSCWKTLLGITALLAADHAVAAPVELAPYLPASTATTRGADASFGRIANDWAGSTVLWDESAEKYGQGLPIGATYGASWGQGLWGYADFVAIRAGTVPLVGGWTGRVDTINFADDCFNQQWSAAWGGAATLAPLFGTTPSCASLEVGSTATNEQDNWVSYFSGFIRVTEPGDDYDFSVLFDDGFFLNLYGGGGAVQSLGMDFLNPRDRLGFGHTFALEAGLYRFELGAWDRLQAGVVDLRWRRGSAEWSLVPLESIRSVPEPGTLGLLAVSLSLALLLRRPRRAPQPDRLPHAS